MIIAVIVIIIIFASWWSSSSSPGIGVRATIHGVTPAGRMASRRHRFHWNQILHQRREGRCVPGIDVRRTKNWNKKNYYYICRRLESCCQAPTSLRGESRSTLSSPRCPGPGLTSSTSSPRWDFETSMTMRLMATMMIMMMSSLKFIEWTCWQWRWQLEWENPGEAKHSFANVALGQKRPRATCSSAPPCFKGGDDDEDFHKNDDDDDDDYDNDKG